MAEEAWRVLAKALGAALSGISLKAGATTPIKAFLIESDPALLMGRLGQLAGAAAA